MRVPIRSEDDAFHAVCGLGAALALAVALGALAGAIAGVAMLSLLVLLGIAWELRSEDRILHSRLRDAQRAGRSAQRGRRTLLVAAAAVTGERDDVLPSHDEPRVLDVLAPVLQSRIHFVTTDIDHERDDARRRLTATLAWAREHGLQADGCVGDPIDPVAGVADELRHFDVDELVVTTLPAARAGWVELGLLEHLRDELDLPLTHVVIDDARPPATTPDPQPATR